jgi:LETM1 and EF-hand domain-containing protein 1
MWMRSVVRHSAGRRLAPGCGCPHWQCAGRAVRLRQYSATPQRGATRTGSAAAPRSKIHNLGSVGGWVLGKLPPRVVTLTEHFIAFLRAYIKGGKLLIREGRVAARLFQRIYLSGHRYSRKERLLMRQSAHDLAKALPMAGLMLTLGLEISTLVVLRGAPGMLPSQLQRTVVPEFQKITGAESTEVAKMNLRATERLDKMHTAVNDLKDTFANDAAGLGAASADEKAALMKFLDDLDDHNAFLCHSDILEMAPLFRRCWTLDQMGRAQLRSVADYIMPSRANVVAPASILRFNLRRRVQHLRVDDKDIYWEGVRSLDYEDLFVACNERGLCRRTGQAFNKKLMTPQSKAILRARLNSWLQLSLNRCVHI